MMNEVRVAEMAIRKPTSPLGMRKHQARILFVEDLIGPENVHKGPS